MIISLNGIGYKDTAGLHGRQCLILEYTEYKQPWSVEICDLNFREKDSPKSKMRELQGENSSMECIASRELIMEVNPS